MRFQVHNDVPVIYCIPRPRYVSLTLVLMTTNKCFKTVEFGLTLENFEIHVIIDSLNFIDLNVTSPVIGFFISWSYCTSLSRSLMILLLVTNSFNLRDCRSARIWSRLNQGQNDRFYYFAIYLYLYWSCISVLESRL